MYVHIIFRHTPQILVGVPKYGEESGRESNSTEKDFERKRARWAQDERADLPWREEEV